MTHPSWALHGRGAQGDLVPPGVLANGSCRADWGGERLQNSVAGWEHGEEQCLGGCSSCSLTPKPLVLPGEMDSCQIFCQRTQLLQRPVLHAGKTHNMSAIP